MSEWVHTFEKHRSENCSGEFHVETSTLYTFMYTDPTYKSILHKSQKVCETKSQNWVSDEWVSTYLRVYFWKLLWRISCRQSSTLTLMCTQILYKGICRVVKVSEWWVSEYISEKYRSENCSWEFDPCVQHLGAKFYMKRFSYGRPNLKSEWVMSEWVHTWEV